MSPSNRYSASWGFASAWHSLLARLFRSPVRRRLPLGWNL